MSELIYVSGPYSGKTPRDVQMNVDRAIAIACDLIRRGHSPYVPHLMHQFYLHPDGDFDYEKFMWLGMEYLKKCDALFLIASSPGADRELRLARTLGLKIYYYVGEVPYAQTTDQDG